VAHVGRGLAEQRDGDRRDQHDEPEHERQRRAAVVVEHARRPHHPTTTEAVREPTTTPLPTRRTSIVYSGAPNPVWFGGENVADRRVSASGLSAATRSSSTTRRSRASPAQPGDTVTVICLSRNWPPRFVTSASTPFNVHSGGSVTGGSLVTGDTVVVVDGNV